MTPKPDAAPDPAQWLRIKSLFDATIDLPAAQREPLMAAAALDPASLAELRSLLANHEAMEGRAGFMADAAAQSLVGGAARVGQRLGNWEIVRAIGSGGMGEVFEARRADGQYEGRAAVKLLKRGMDSAAVLQRFALERQALARLNHPHIARLLDAGASDEGLPYFVLEFVDGKAIDSASLGLPVLQRLRLFLQLADAVAHAHRSLLVHRDLKPANVLVDQQGQVKLLDFGIAKALDPLEGGDGHTTVGGVRPFTPNYASPEQVRGEPVTTATDIYSLGVLLYQMMTGARPTGRDATSPADAARSVLEEQPTLPSRLSPAVVLDTQWLATRKQLEGDLDNIMLKALEKAVERRYSSVEAMASDVRAFLAGHPVSARPASAFYVLNKFVRRNRWPVLAAALGGLGLATGLAAALLQGRQAAALGVLGLGAGLAMALMQAARATRASRAADEQLSNVKELLRGLVVRYSYGVWLTPKGSRLMQSFVEESLPRLERALAAAPLDMELKAIGADIYARLAEMMGANALVAASGALTGQAAGERAMALGLAALPSRMGDGAFVARVAIGRVSLAGMAQAAGTPEKGVPYLEAALQDVDASLLQDRSPLGRAYLRGARGSIFMVWGKLHDHGGEASLGDPDKALELLALAAQEFHRFVADRDGIEAIEAESPEDDIDTEASVLQALGGTHVSMAMVHIKSGHIDLGLAETTRATELYERIVRDFRPNLLFNDGLVSAATLLAYLGVRSGDAQAALQAGTTAWVTNTKLIESEGAQSRWAGRWPRVAAWYGAALQMSGRPADACPVLREAFEKWQEKALSESPRGADQRTAEALGLSGLHLARAQQELGQTAEALTTCQDALVGLNPALAAPQRVAETLMAAIELHVLKAQLNRPDSDSDHSAAAGLAQDMLRLKPLPADLQARAMLLASPGA